MWIDGVSPLSVLEAFVAATVAIVHLRYSCVAFSSTRYSPIDKHARAASQIEWPRFGIVALILVVAILANVIANLRFPASARHAAGDRNCGLGRDPLNGAAGAGPTGK